MSETKFMSHNSQKQYDFKIKGYVAERISEAISSHSHSDLANQDDINQLKAYIDQSSDNIINQISKKTDTLRNAAGATITMSDSAKVPIQGLRLFGKTTQNTTTGKNLLPNSATSQTIFGVTFTVDSDGVITVNGTAENYADLYVYGQQNNNENYLFIPKGSKFVGAENAAANPFWIFREKTAGNIYNVHNINPLLEERDCYFYGVCLRVSIDKTVSNFKTAPMFCVATSDDTYEPYTGGIPSPNPDYPQELVSAGDGGSLGVTVAGKNLLSNNVTSGTINGVTFTVNADGSVTMNGTATADVSFPIFGNNWNDTSKKLILDGNIDYILSKGTANAVVYARDAISNRNFETPLNSYRIIEKVDCLTYVYIRILKGKTLNNETIYPMICLASIADDIYEPYKQSQTLNISTPNGLPGIPVTSGGNYTDETGQQWVCDEVDFGRGIYVQRIFGTVFKSAVGWNIAGTKNGLKRFYTNQFMGVIKNAKDDATKECALCSHFINVTASDTWNEVTGISVNSKGRLDIYYSGIEQTTAALDVYFSSNPVAFMAELATPIETPLSAEELAAYAALHTNYPNTTILNDGGAGMEVKYCTPSTSVPMVHSEGDKGKILTIDEHGCIAKAVPGEFSAIDVDFGVSNEAEPSPINADTLGGRSADEYILKSQIPIEANYSVIGGITEPTNPTQNMIWVNTDIPIGRIFFGDNEPNETFIDGDVWIETGAVSTVAFNALRIGENYVNMVYPLSVKQYVNGAWVDKTAKSYQGGEWVDWWHGELYKNGNTYEYITGGWKQTIATNGTITFNSDSIKVSIDRNADGATFVGPKNAIDFTNYNTLSINVTDFYIQNASRICLYVNRTSIVSASDNTAALTLDKKGVISLDVSELEGFYYIGVGGGWFNPCSATFNEVMLS